jgi:hypothetical protein
MMPAAGRYWHRSGRRAVPLLGAGARPACGGARRGRNRSGRGRHGGADPSSLFSDPYTRSPSAHIRTHRFTHCATVAACVGIFTVAASSDGSPGPAATGRRGRVSMPTDRRTSVPESSVACVGSGRLAGAASGEATSGAVTGEGSAFTGASSAHLRACAVARSWRSTICASVMVRLSWRTRSRFARRRAGTVVVAVLVVMTAVPRARRSAHRCNGTGAQARLSTDTAKCAGMRRMGVRGGT